MRVYRWTLSPAKMFLFGPLGGCRFQPSCSEYALEAVRLHGALAGSWLALKRIGRCHPWGGCGEDPVPERSKSEIRNPRSEINPRAEIPTARGRLQLRAKVPFCKTSSRAWVGRRQFFGFRIMDQRGKQLSHGH